MTFERTKYQDDTIIPSEADAKDFHRFPISFAHLVEIGNPDGAPKYGVRVRKIDGELGFIDEFSRDYDVMRDKLDYVRMNMMIRRTYNVPRAHDATMKALGIFGEGRERPEGSVADEAAAAPVRIDPDAYHADPIVPSEADEDDYKRFPVSYAHLVRLDGPDGETLFSVRCRNASAKLKLMYVPTAKLADIREELEYVQVNLLVRRTLAAPYAHGMTMTMLRAFWRDRRAADETVDSAAPSAPGSK